MRFIEKSLLLQVLDAVWKEHLYALDHLRQGIGLRAYGQRDPLNEYKAEAFALFNAMLDELKERVTMMLARVELAPEQPAPAYQPMQMQVVESHPEPVSALSGGGREPELALEGAAAGAATMSVEARPMRAGVGRSERSEHLAECRAQRIVPVRIGTEVQALSREVLVGRMGGQLRAFSP